MRRCVHDRTDMHAVIPDEPTWFAPPMCGGSPDNWFIHWTAKKLHRWGCTGDIGALVVDGPRDLFLATPEDVWVLPVGKCCRDDAAQRYAEEGRL